MVFPVEGGTSFVGSGLEPSVRLCSLSSFPDTSACGGKDLADEPPECRVSDVFPVDTPPSFESIGPLALTEVSPVSDGNSPSDRCPLHWQFPEVQSWDATGEGNVENSMWRAGAEGGCK